MLNDSDHTGIINHSDTGPLQKRACYCCNIDVPNEERSSSSIFRMCMCEGFFTLSLVCTWLHDAVKNRHFSFWIVMYIFRSSVRPFVRPLDKSCIDQLSPLIDLTANVLDPLRQKMCWTSCNNKNATKSRPANKQHIFYFLASRIDYGDLRPSNFDCILFSTNKQNNISN